MGSLEARRVAEGDRTSFWQAVGEAKWSRPFHCLVLQPRLLQSLIQIIRRPAPRICSLPLGISSERQRAKHCRYARDERTVLSEQHPVIMQAFDPMNNPISLLRFTCAQIFSSRINLDTQHQD